MSTIQTQRIRFIGGSDIWWYVPMPWLSASRRACTKGLTKLNKLPRKLAAKPHQDHCALQTKVQSILKRYRVINYFFTEIETETVTRYAGPGRPSRQDPNRTIVSTQFQLKWKFN